MRSAIHHQFGDPTNVLVVGDSPLPEPAPGEVRIRMQLAPIHNHDLLTVRGQYGYKPPLPALGGSAGLGVVDALGAGVDGLSVGPRVAAASGRELGRASCRERVGLYVYISVVAVALHKHND